MLVAEEVKDGSLSTDAWEPPIDQELHETVTCLDRRPRRSKEAQRKNKEALKQSRLLQRTATPFGGERRLMAATAGGPSFAGLQSLLPDNVSYYLRKRVDFLEIDGEMPISAVSSDWSWQFVGRDGAMCELSPIIFDETNAHGASVWGPAMEGAIAVTLRGRRSFEAMARNAEAAGAAGLVVINQKSAWDESFQMCLDSPGFAGIYLAPPKIPAILVPKSAKELLCAGRSGLRARFVRR